MRTLMPPEILSLFREVEPFLDDKAQLVPDAPEDIKRKLEIVDAYYENERKKNGKMNR